MRKTVLVTGSSRGLGKSIIEEFAKIGYDVIINYNNNSQKSMDLKAYIEDKYNVSATIIKCDVSKEDEVIRMKEEILKKYKNIDILINNAGICLDNSMDDKNSDEFMRVIEVNLLGTYLVTKYISTIMSKGSIVNISSSNAIDTFYIESIDYDASKAGIISLTNNFSRYLSPNIRVNSVLPGWFESDMTKDLDNEYRKKEEDKILLKRFARVEEISSVVKFVAVDATYMNNSIIRVDGGVNNG